MVNRGHLFYEQIEIGKSELGFNIVKLCSIIKKVYLNGVYFASKRNICITKYFEFSRKTRLDKIFQFHDVFVGDMNLIGPRPESLS
jgi:lipopolysaccharide/colanic/teichoic acid biosynthesis glycosyltransferase